MDNNIKDNQLDFFGMSLSGMDMNSIKENIPEGYEPILNSPDFYKSKVLDSYFKGDEVKFTEHWNEVSKQYNDYLVNKETYNQEKHLYGPAVVFNESMSKVDPTYGKKKSISYETDMATEPFANPMLGETSSNLTNEQQGLLNNYYIDETKLDSEGKPTKVPYAPTASDKMFNLFVVKQNEYGKNYLAKIDPSTPTYNLETVNAWGEKQRYGYSYFSEPIKATLSEAIPTTAQALILSVKYLGDLGIGGYNSFVEKEDKINPDKAMSGLIQARNEMERIKYQPSEEIASQGPTESIGSALNSIGSMAGFILAGGGLTKMAGLGFKGLTATGLISDVAAKSAIKTASHAITANLMARGVYEESKINGLSDSEAATMALLSAPVVILAGKLSHFDKYLGRMTQTEKQAFKNDFAEIFKSIPKEELVKESGKLKFLKSLVNKMSTYSEKANTGVLKNALTSSIQGGAFMTIQEFGFAVEKQLWDNTFGLNRNPQEGKFGYEFTDQLATLPETFLVGAVSSGLLSPFLPKPQQEKIDIMNIYRQDKEKGMAKFKEINYENFITGKYGELSKYDKDGKIILSDTPVEPFKINYDLPGIENREIKTMAEQNYYMADQALNEMKLIVDGAGLSNPLIENMFKKDPTNLIKTVLKNHLEISEIKKQIEVLSKEREVLTDENAIKAKDKEISELNEKLNGKTETIKLEDGTETERQVSKGLIEETREMIVPEENTKYSKPINENVKNKITVSEALKRKTDNDFAHKGPVDDNVRQSKEYAEKYISNMQAQKSNLYNYVKTYNDIFDNYIERLKTYKQEQQVEDSKFVGTIKETLGKLASEENFKGFKDLSISEQSKKLASINSQLNDIINRVDFDIPEVDLKDITSQLDKINESVKTNYKELADYDIDNIEPGEVNPDRQEIVQSLMQFNSKEYGLEGNTDRDFLHSFKEKLSTKQGKYEIDIDKEYKDFFTKDIETELGHLKEIVDKGGMGISTDVLEQGLDLVKKRLDIYRNAADGKNILFNNKEVKEHIVSTDRPIDNEFYKELHDKYAQYDQAILEIEPKINSLLGNKSTRVKRNQRIDQKSQKQNIASFMYKTGEGDKQKDGVWKKFFDDNGITKMYEQLGEIDVWNKDLVELTEEQEKKLEETEILLNKINTTINLKINEVKDGKSFLTKENIKEWMDHSFSGESLFYQNIVEEIQPTVPGKHPTQFDIEKIKDIPDGDYTNYTYYLSAVNQLLRWSGINETETTINREKILDENKPISNQEQKTAENQLGAFFEEGHKVFNIIRDIELERNAKVKDGQFKKQVEKYYIHNSIVVRGLYGTGKNDVVFTNALKLHQIRHENDKDVKPSKVVIVGIGKQGADNIKKQIEGIVNIDENVKTLTHSQLHENSYQGVDYLIIDEFSALTETDITKLKTKLEGNTNTKVIFIGDNVQMRPVDTDTFTAFAEKTGIKTIPLTEIYSNENIVLQNLANHYLTAIYSGTTSELPKSWHELNSKGKKVGTEYFGGRDAEAKIIDSFKNDNNDNKALVVLNEREYNRVLKENGWEGPEADKVKIRSKIYILDTKSIPGGLQSCQGLRFENVYLNVDFEHIDSIPVSDQAYADSKLKAYAGYTGVGRASNYVAVIADGVKYDSRPVFWSNEVKDRGFIPDHENFINEQQRLRNIIEGSGYDTTIKTETTTDTKDEGFNDLDKSFGADKSKEKQPEVDLDDVIKTKTKDNDVDFDTEQKFTQHAFDEAKKTGTDNLAQAHIHTALNVGKEEADAIRAVKHEMKGFKKELVYVREATPYGGETGKDLLVVRVNPTKEQYEQFISRLRKRNDEVSKKVLKEIEDYNKDKKEDLSGDFTYNKETVDKIHKILKSIYPNITVEFTDNPIIAKKGELESKNYGKTDLKALETLIYRGEGARSDTLPHEFAHNYIKWFEDSTLVQEAYKMFEGDNKHEQLVQAIGEQVIKQKGEVFNWWKKFSTWVNDLFNSKENTVKYLTDAFLEGRDISGITKENYAEKDQGNYLPKKYRDYGLLEKGGTANPDPTDIGAKRFYETLDKNLADLRSQGSSTFGKPEVHLGDVKSIKVIAQVNYNKGEKKSISIKDFIDNVKAEPIHTGIQFEKDVYMITDKFGVSKPVLYYSFDGKKPDKNSPYVVLDTPLISADKAKFDNELKTDLVLLKDKTNPLSSLQTLQTVRFNNSIIIKDESINKKIKNYIEQYFYIKDKRWEVKLNTEGYPDKEGLKQFISELLTGQSKSTDPTKFYENNAAIKAIKDNFYTTYPISHTSTDGRYKITDTSLLTVNAKGIKNPYTFIDYSKPIESIKNIKSQSSSDDISGFASGIEFQSMNKIKDIAIINDEKPKEDSTLSDKDVNTEAKIKYGELSKIFGGYVEQTRVLLAKEFNDRSYFSSDINTPKYDINGVFNSLRESFSRNAEIVSEIKTGTGKLIKQLSKEDFTNGTLTNKEKQLYIQYQVGQKDIFNAFAKRLYDNLDIVNGEYKMHVDTNHYDKDKFNPETLSGDNLKGQLQIIPYRESIDGVLQPWNGRSFVSLKEVKNNLNEATAEVMRTIGADRSNFRVLLMDALEQNANKRLDNNYRSNAIRSFLYKFYDNNGISLLSIKERLENKYRNNLDPVRDRIEAIENVLTNLENNCISLYKVRHARVELDRFNNARLVKSDLAEHAPLKNDIFDLMKVRLFDEDWNVKDKKVQQLEGKDALWSISDKGLSWVKGNEGNGTQFIQVTPDGKVSFTKEFTEQKAIQNILMMKGFFGIDNIGVRSLVNMFTNQESNVENIKDVLKNYKPEDPKNIGKEVLAKGMLGMFLATKANIELNREIKAAFDKVDMEDPSQLKQFEKDKNTIIEEFWKKQTLLNKIYNDFGVKKVDDIGMTMSDPEQVYINSDERMPKPMDLWQFFNVMAKNEIYERGNEYADFSYRPDGSKVYNYQLNSYLSDTLYYGTEKIEKIFRDIKDEQDMSNSIYIKDGKILNRFLDTNNNSVIKELWELDGIKSMTGTGTVDPNITDTSTMTLDAFMNSVIKSNDLALEEFDISLNNVSDKLKLYLATFIPDRTNARRFIDANISKGVINRLKVNDSYLVEHVQNKFDRLERAQELSAKAWKDTLKAFDKEGVSLPTMFAKGLYKDFDVNGLEERFNSDYSKIADKEKFYRAVRRSDLRLNVDYIVEGENTIKLGLATTMNKYDNSEVIANFDNYNKWKSAAEKNVKLVDEIYEQEYINYSKKIHSVGYNVSEQVKDLSKSKFIYDTATKEFNPFYKAHFFAYEIVNENLSPFISGTDQGFINSTDKSKRFGSIVTGMSHLTTNKPYTLNPKCKMIYIEDNKQMDKVIGKMKKTHDSQGVGNALWEYFFERSIGGYEQGPTGKSPIKTLLNQHNYETGKFDQVKHAVDFIGETTYKNNPYYRVMFKQMLDATTDLVKENSNIKNFDLYGKFEEFYNKEQNFKTAIEKTAQWIVEDNDVDMRNLIKDNLVWGMQNASGVKQGLSRVNDFYGDLKNNRKSKLALTDIQTDKIGVVLNPAQDIYRDKNITAMNQILALVGNGSDSNAVNAKGIYDSLTRIANTENQKLVDRFIADPTQTLRDIGINSITNSGYSGRIGEDLNNLAMNINRPDIRAKLIQYFRNHLTDQTIRQKMYGIRVNQMSGQGFYIFEKDGHRYTMEEVARTSKINEAKVIQAVESGTDYNGYKVRELNTMQSKDGKMMKAEIGVSFSHFKKFGLEPGNTINDVFTLKLKKGIDINMRNMSEEEISKTLADNKDNIDFGKTIASKFYINKGQEGTEKQIVDYLNAFNHSLNMYIGRVPAGRLGFGAICEAAFFVQDNGNVAYIPFELTSLADSDFDIDQLSLYTKYIGNNLEYNKDINRDTDPGNINSFEQMNDYILDKLYQIYEDPKNAKNILVESNLDNLRKLANNQVTKKEYNKLSEEEKLTSKYSKILRKNSFATMLHDYEINEAGANAIPIFARSLSTMGYLFQIRDKETLNKVMPGFKNLYENLNKQGQESYLGNFGDYLQAALDNAKELILGNLGITTPAVPLIPAMIMSGKDNLGIKSFLMEKVIKDVFYQVSKGESIKTKNSDYKILDIIDNKIENINLAKEQQAEVEKNAYKQLDAITDSRLKDIEKEKLEQQFAKTTNFERDKKLLNELKEYVNKGEFLRRVGDFVALRNGIEVNDFEFEKLIANLEQSLGQSLNDFIAGKGSKENYINEHLNFYKNNNPEYYTQEVRENKAVKRAGNRVPDFKSKLHTMVARENDIAKVGNIREIVKNFSNIETYTKLIQQENNRTNEFWIYNRPGLKDWMMKDGYLGTIEMNSWDYKQRRAMAYEKVAKVITDLYFKNSKNVQKNINIEIPIQGIDGIYRTDVTTNSKIDLSTRSGRELYKKQFPEYINFIKDALETSDISVFEQMGFSREEYNIIKGNKFIDRLGLYGLEGRSHIVLRESMALTPDMIEQLKSEYQKLPVKLKQLFAYNEFISNGFKYRNGSIVDIIGNELFEDVSTVFSNFEDLLNKKDNSFKKQFIESVQHGYKGVPFYNEELHSKDEIGSRPVAVLKKVKIKEGVSVNKLIEYNEESDSYPQLNIKDKINDEIETNPDSKSDYLFATKVPVVKIFTPKELVDFRDRPATIVKDFMKGHAYKDGEIYSTELGDLVVADRVSNTKVIFKRAVTKNVYDYLCEQATKKAQAIKDIEDQVFYQKMDINTISTYNQGIKIDRDNILKVTKEFSKYFNVPLIEENNKSVKEKLGDFGGRTWIEDDGIHFNIENISSTDFLHELSPLWYKSISSYNSLFEKAKQLIKTDDILVSAVKEVYKANNIPITDNTLLQSTMATLAGLTDKQAVKDFFIKSNIKEVPDIDSTWDQIKDISKKINGWSKDILGINKDFKDITLNDYFKALASEAFSANGKTKTDIQYLNLMDSVKGEGVHKEFKTDNTTKAEVILTDKFGPNHTTKDKNFIQDVGSQILEKTNTLISYNKVENEDGEILYQAYPIKDALREDVKFDKEVSEDIKDFHSLFNKNVTDTKAYSDLKMKEWEDDIYNDIIKNTRPGNKQFYAGKYIGNNLKGEELRQAIRREIINHYNENAARVEFKEFIDAVHADKNKDKDVKTIAEETFGGRKYSVNQLNRMINVTGINEGVVKMLPYEKLATENSPELKKLYKKGFIGYNPEVIVHNVAKDGTIDISLIDITSRPVSNSVNSFDESKGLQSIFKVTDKEYKELGGRLQNHDIDIRKLMLGLQLMSMMKDNKVRVRNVGILQTTSGVRAYMVNDIKALINEVKLIRDNPRIMKFVKDDNIRNIILDNSLYEKEFNQSYLARLKTYLEETLGTERLTEGQINFTSAQLDILNNPDVTESDLKRVILQRKRWIESRVPEEKLTDSDEYRMLSQVHKELETGFSTRINRIEDMSEGAMMVTTGLDISDDNLQLLRDTYTKNKYIVYDKVRELKKEMDPLFKEMIKQYDRLHNVAPGMNRLYSLQSKYFEHLFKTQEAKDKEGNTHTVRLPELHWTLTDNETKIKYDRGELTDTDLKFASKLIELIDNRWINNLYHVMKLSDELRSVDGKSTLTREDVIKLIEKTPEYGYKKGMIPVIAKSTNELLMSGKIKDAAKRTGELLSNYEILFEGEQDNMNPKFNEVSNHFNGQLDEIRRYEKLGLRIEPDKNDNGKKAISVLDIDMNNHASTNLETIFNYFNLAGIRKEVYENNVLPVYNSVRTILKMYDAPTDGSQRIAQTNNLKWAEEYFARNILRTNLENKYNVPIYAKFGTKFNPDGTIKNNGIGVDGQVSFTNMGRGFIGGLSFLTLGYSAGVGFKSFIFNEMQLLSNSLASSIAGLSFGSAALPGLPEVHAAHMIIAEALTNPHVPEFKKMMELGMKFQLIHGTERDLIENPMINLTNKNLFQSAYAHWFNQITDSASRLIAMTAIMKKDGSWDAYKYDEQSGEVTYNEKLDKRFYDQSGNLKKEQGEHVLREGLRKRLVAEGSQKESDKELKTGYDYELINGKFKWYADKYIIGTMDESYKPIIGNRLAGAMVSQFKIFSFARLFNLGIFAKERKSTLGVSYKAVKDENGNWISVKELMAIEGALQSVGKALRALNNQNNESLSQWWENANPTTKLNLAKTLIQVGMFAFILGMVKGFSAGDDNKEKKWNWAYQDVFIAPTLTSMFTGNPMPSVQMVQRFYKNATTGDERKIMKTFGVTRTIQSGIDMLPEDNDNETNNNK